MLEVVSVGLGGGTEGQLIAGLNLVHLGTQGLDEGDEVGGLDAVVRDRLEVKVDAVRASAPDLCGDVSGPRRGLPKDWTGACPVTWPRCYPRRNSPP